MLKAIKGEPLGSRQGVKRWKEKMASILIVDDQASSRERISMELVEDGYEVASVSDAEGIWGELRSSTRKAFLMKK